MHKTKKIIFKSKTLLYILAVYLIFKLGILINKSKFDFISDSSLGRIIINKTTYIL